MRRKTLAHDSKRELGSRTLNSFPLWFQYMLSISKTLGRLFLVILISVAASLTPPLAWSQAQTLPKSNELTQKVGIDQKLGAQIPLELSFFNEKGQKVQLKDYFEQKPIVLMLVFYNCKGVCAMEFDGVNGLIRSLKTEKLARDFDIVTVGIHPKETPELALSKKNQILQIMNKPEIEPGWHFLTGDLESINKVSQSVGFRFTYNPESDLINHAAAIMILTPEGKVSRYFFGTTYTGKLVKEALDVARNKNIGAPEYKPMLLGCIAYDAKSHRYTVVVDRLLIVGGCLTAFLLGLSIMVMSIKSKRRPSTGPGAKGGAASA